MKRTMDRSTLTDRTERRLLSVIVPCFNEQSVIAETHARLKKALAAIPGLSHEIIYVNDGSSDGTMSILRGIQSDDPTVRVLSFSRNFGHQIAVTAGIQHAKGDAVVLIDADLQDPPEVIEEFVSAWRQGADVAYGVRTARDGESRFKLATAKAFYRIINGLSDTQIPVDTGDFRLMDRRVVDALDDMPEHDRFVRGMVSWVGFRQEPVHYERAARFAGTTKYPLAKMVRFATDGILSFSLVPLRLSVWMGLGAAALSMLGIIYALVVRLLTDDWVPGWAMIFIALLFIGGVQLLSLGVVGEYVGRIYGEVKRRPLYVVDERLGFGENASRDESRERSAFG